VYASIEKHFREGLRAPVHGLTYGQLITAMHEGVPAVHLWPLDWVANAAYQGEPLATLWRPELRMVREATMLLAGVEKADGRRWVVQKWTVSPTSRELAMKETAARR
jgi:hypothetical protein